MARVKYYDSTTQTWKYADMALQTGIHVGTTAPTNEAMLWVDTASNQIDSFPLTDVQDSDGNSLIVNQIAVIPTMPNGTNTGDILEWDGDEWVAKSAPSIPEFTDLPCAYQKTEYIEGTGTQYIAYYYKPIETDRIEYDVAFTGDVSTGNFGVMGGLNYATETKSRFTIAYWLGKWQYAVGEDAYQTDINADNNRHKFIIDGTEGKFYVDNNAINMTMGQIGGYIDFCALFGRGQQDHTIVNITSAKLYSVKIYRNSKLLANSVGLPIDVVPYKYKFRNKRAVLYIKEVL